jgi:hypothetical protein
MLIHHLESRVERFINAVERLSCTPTNTQELQTSDSHPKGIMAMAIATSLFMIPDRYYQIKMSLQDLDFPFSANFKC